MSDVIDLKARRLEKAKTIKEEFLIDNDYDEVSVLMVPLIEALEQLTEAFSFLLHNNEKVDLPTEFLNHCMAMFDAATESMIEQVENKSQEPFFFYDESSLDSDLEVAEVEFGFTHGPDVLDKFVAETRRADGTFNLERAIQMACALRAYNIHVTSILGELIDDFGPQDPLAKHKPVT